MACWCTLSPSGNIRYIESASTNDDYFYLADGSKHRIVRVDLSGTTISSSQIKSIGKRGRLRLNLPIEDYNTIYEGGAGKKIPSWAFKWQNSFNWL